MSAIPFDNEIKTIAMDVMQQLGRASECMSVLHIEGAKTENGTSGADDRAGTWQVQCGTDMPFLLTLSNRQIVDQAKRAEIVKNEILRRLRK